MTQTNILLPIPTYLLLKIEQNSAYTTTIYNWKQMKKKFEKFERSKFNFFLDLKTAQLRPRTPPRNQSNLTSELIFVVLR